MNRVVVTGIGALTPIGNSFVQSWDALKAGKSGIGRIKRFDATYLPWSCAGEIKGFDAGVFLTGKEINKLDPFVQYAVAAAVMAVEDAGLMNSNESAGKSSSPVTRHPSLSSGGVIIGSSRGGISTIEKALLKGLKTELLCLRRTSSDPPLGGRAPNLRLSPYIMPSTTVSMAASYVAQKLGIRGNCLGISNACASGANAVGEAFRLIKMGFADIALAGGTETPICRICVEGYGIAGALSKDNFYPENVAIIPRPFDRDRDGFVLSEGACVLILEEYGNALKRGANIYGEIVGYGNTTDAFHITRPDPGGEARAMTIAVNEAGIAPDQVDYINTHGTATLTGDIAEAGAIKMVFEKRASLIPATAVKSMTGHMLAASGAFEVASTLMSIKEGIIPPTINLIGKDAACDINIVTEMRRADIRIAVSNSFGFGGVNSVLVLKAL